EYVAIGMVMDGRDGRPPIFSFIHEYQRIVDGGIGLSFECIAAGGQSVAHCSVHLGHAAEGICVLHAPTFAMRFANLAALEHGAQVCSGLELTGMRTHAMNAFIKSDIGPAEGVERHG